MMRLGASPPALLALVLAVYTVATVHAEGASVECAVCEVVLNTAAKFGGNASSIADAITHLAQDCDKIFGAGNGTLDRACKNLSRAAINIFPTGVSGLGKLAWDARAGCAALGSCKVPCCSSLAPVTPQQVHLALHSDRNAMTVMWTTLSPTQMHTVQWAKSPLVGVGNSTQSAQGVNATYTHFGWQGELHRATMTDLEPGTRYWYRVGDGTASSKGRGWSKVFSFTTLRAGAGAEVPLRLGSVGDMGWGNRSDATISRLEALVDAGQIDAVLHAGDIGYADGAMAHWDVFMRKIEGIAARVPYMTVPGNHELWFNFTAYKTRFAMPLKENDANDGPMFWSAQLGAVHVLGMCTESALDVAAMGDAQLEWIRRDLAGHTSMPGAFTIVLGHRPLYCSNTGGNDVPAGNKVLQGRVEDTLVEANVDLVVQGHVHDYERSLPVRFGAVDQRNYSKPNAPVYVANGAAGNRENNDRAPANLPWNPAPHEGGAGPRPFASNVSFAVLTVVKGNLTWQQFDSVSGVEIDQFSIVK